MAWSCVEPSKSLGFTQLSRQRVQSARRSGIGSLLVIHQFLICSLQCSIREDSGPQWLSA